MWGKVRQISQRSKAVEEQMVEVAEVGEVAQKIRQNSK
jgi:hypothetical protein